MSMFSSRLYNDVNFLPGWYVQARARKRSLQRTAALSIFVIAGMVLLLGQTWHTRSELTAYHAELERKLASTKMQITEATKLRRALADLQTQLKVHRQLHKPINYSQITGTLGNLMPPTVALANVTLATERLTETRTLKPSDPRYTQAKQAVAGSGREPTVTETCWVVAIDLQGVAPSDQDIANFIGALASSNLFQNVKMIYSKKGTRGRLITREFRMRMTVPLNCEYRDLSAPQEVADAH